MTEKYKIYLSEDTKSRLINDAELFEFFRNDGTVNLNGFLKELIVNYFDQYRNDNDELLANVLEELTSVKSLKAKDASILADKIIRTYITNKEMNELDSVVKDHEPDIALRAGDTGLDFYGPILNIAKALLKDGGALIVEHGYEQGDPVRKIFEQGGLKNCMTIRDYGGNQRVTVGIK